MLPAPKKVYDAIVVGSGLAGLTASLELLARGLSVALVEKTDKLGGNSAKASSGINGVPTRYQNRQEGDSVSAFVEDTLKSGKGLSKPELVDILAQDSADAIHWLADTFQVDLSAVTRLGGHSFARTHRGSGKLPPGFAIVSALSKKLKESSVDIMTDTLMKGFVKEGKRITGVRVSAGSEDKVYGKHVIMATGGFSADFTSSSLLQRFRPDLINFPLTNGQQTTGDGHKLAESELGAQLLHMDQVQVHPTGFVQLKDANSAASKWKFLCGELIRGIGGILLSPVTGKRFVNELATRDVVASEILAKCGDVPVAAVVVSAEDYEKARAHIDFYVSQNVMFKGTAEDIVSKFQSVDVAASLEEIEAGIAESNQALFKGDELKRPHFGHPLGKEFYFGIITPVLHFSMGGVETNDKSQVVTQNGRVIDNVFAIGEASAGVHGGNRLAGSSLLECVVFGRRVADYIVNQIV